VKKRRKSLDPLSLDDDRDLLSLYDEDDGFWEGLEGDITAAQKKAVELIAIPRGRALYTLTELSSGEVKALASLKTLGELIPDPILVGFVRNYALMKRAAKRKGVKELIAIVGGRAWRILQNINLSRLRRVHETSETGEW